MKRRNFLKACGLLPAIPVVGLAKPRVTATEMSGIWEGTDACYWSIPDDVDPMEEGKCVLERCWIPALGRGYQIRIRNDLLYKRCP